MDRNAAPTGIASVTYNRTPIVKCPVSLPFLQHEVFKQQIVLFGIVDIAGAPSGLTKTRYSTYRTTPSGAES